VWHEPIVFFGPVAMQVGEGRVIDDTRNGVIDLAPEVGKGRIGLALCSRFTVRAAFKEAIDFPHSDLARLARKQISAFGASAGLYKSTLFQVGQDELQELLGDLLASGDFGYFYGLTGRLVAKVEERAQGVFTFHGDVH